MESIRKACAQDASRLAEILIFAKRAAYRPVFHNDKVSFGEMQVLPLAQDFLEKPDLLEPVWVWDDEFVKGLIHVEKGEVMELYIDPFFQGQGIGGKLLDFAVEELDARFLWVLEKNRRAIDFYERHGFQPSGERQPEPGTEEYIIRMDRSVL